MDVEHTPSSPASKKRRHLGRYHRAVRVSRQGDSKRTSCSGWRPARRYQRAEEQSVGARVGKASKHGHEVLKNSCLIRKFSVRYREFCKPTFTVAQIGKTPLDNKPREVRALHRLRSLTPVLQAAELSSRRSLHAAGTSARLRNAARP